MIPRGIYYKKYVTQTFCTLVQIEKGAGVCPNGFNIG